MTLSKLGTTMRARLMAVALLALLLSGAGAAAAYPLDGAPDGEAPEASLEAGDPGAAVLDSGDPAASGLTTADPATGKLPPADPSANDPMLAGALAAGPEVAPGIHRYIVLLTDPPVAEYAGGIGGLLPTAIDAVNSDGAAGDDATAHLDSSSVASESYVRFLERTQNLYINRIRRIAPELDVGWRYVLASNGFSADMTPEHALDVLRMPGVRLVYPEEKLELELDSTAQLLGTAAAWEEAGGREEAGLGVRLGILDSGADAPHPMFNDEGMPDAPEGFPAATLHGRKNDAVLDYSDPTLTNNKVIATRVFAAEATSETVKTILPWAFLTPDNDPHGVHVAGIAGGRYGTYNVTASGQSVPVTMGGVAPMSNLLVYINREGGTTGMLAIYEQMLKDEVDVVNISQGHAGWLLTGQQDHPIALAQRAAATAGLLTVASAGNAGGNGRTSLSGAWKYSDDILVVGNSTSVGNFGLQATVSGAGMPESLATLPFSPVSSPIITTDLEAPLYLVASGNGCTADAGAGGKIAVFVYSEENGAVAGTCTIQVRATTMQQSGATGMLMVYKNAYIGPSGTLTNLALPTWTIGRNGGLELLSWLGGGGSGTARVLAGIKRGYFNLPDLLQGSSSRGPGLNWGVKPDITAPGTSILSSYVTRSTNAQGQVQINHLIASLSGTSMSSPHVAGAAALIRSVHKDWSLAKVKSALINTSAPVLKNGNAVNPSAATVTDGGPGRLDMSRVLDPGAFLYPQKLSFGVMPEDSEDELEVTIESASDKAATWSIAIEVGAGDGKPSVDLNPAEMTLAPGERKEIFVAFDTAGLAGSEHWGHLVFTNAETGQVLRQAYYAFVNQEDNREDVLVINWTYGNTQSYASYYTDALDALGLTYSVWNMGEPADGLTDLKTGHPTFAEMYRHELVILNTNMSPISLQQRLAGQFQYQNFLLAGGNLLVAGQGTQGWWRYLLTDPCPAPNCNPPRPYPDTPELRAAYPDSWPWPWYPPLQNLGCEMCLARYFAGYTPVLTATLSGKLLVPFPMKPAEPEMDVVLAPHAEADGPFTFPLDISTGGKAPQGAAGNQYRFNSGRVVTGYVESGETDLEEQTTHLQGDVSYGEVAMNSIIPLARPLWSYTVADENGDAEALTVGTYVAGRQHPEAKPRVAWNAMYWGFGLEGVGQGAPGSVSRARLLGDTFNFLARNLYATATNIGVVPDGDSPAISVQVSDIEDEVLIAGTEVDWGDGGPVEKETFPDPKPIPAQQVFTHKYAADGSYWITITMIPDPDQSPRVAPINASIQVRVDRTAEIYLPLQLLNDVSLSPPRIPAPTDTPPPPTGLATIEDATPPLSAWKLTLLVGAGYALGVALVLDSPPWRRRRRKRG